MFVNGLVWITCSTWEEKEQLRNLLFVGTIEVKVDLDKKEAIKALQRNTTQDVRVDSEQGAPILPLCNVDDQSCLQKQGASI